MESTDAAIGGLLRSMCGSNEHDTQGTRKGGGTGGFVTPDEDNALEAGGTEERCNACPPPVVVALTFTAEDEVDDEEPLTC